MCPGPPFTYLPHGEFLRRKLANKVLLWWIANTMETYSVQYRHWYGVHSLQELVDVQMCCLGFLMLFRRILGTGTILVDP